MGMFREGSSDPRNTPKNLEFFVHKEKNFDNFGVQTKMPQRQDHKEYVHQVSLSYDDGNLEKNRGNSVVRSRSRSSSSRTVARLQNRDFLSAVTFDLN